MVDVPNTRRVHSSRHHNPHSGGTKTHVPYLTPTTFRIWSWSGSRSRSLPPHLHAAPAGPGRTRQRTARRRKLLRIHRKIHHVSEYHDGRLRHRHDNTAHPKLFRPV